MISSILHEIYHWLYSRPIIELLQLTALLTVVFLFLRERYGTLRRWRAGCWGLLAIWLAAVVWITLGGRGEGGWQEPVLIPFHSYYTVFTGGQRELLRSNFMNMLLFYSAGLLAGTVLPKRWKGWHKVLLIASVCCAMSLSVELGQYYGRLGLGETDDVIHNTLGAVIGVKVSLAIQGPIQRKEK